MHARSEAATDGALAFYQNSICPLSGGGKCSGDAGKTTTGDHDIGIVCDRYAFCRFEYIL